MFVVFMSGNRVLAVRMLVLVVMGVGMNQITVCVLVIVDNLDC